MEKGNASNSNGEKGSISTNYMLSCKLFNLIASVKEINQVTNVKEVLDGLKEYITLKKLFDPHEPYKICCKNDELGSVFGVEQFSIPEVARFLPKLLTPVYSEDCSLSNSVDNNSKRKIEGTCTPNKKSKIDEIFIYIPPSPIRGSGSDSAESFQGYETAIVKDTSDESICLSEVDKSDDNFDILAVEETYNIEYEVESLSSLSSEGFYSSCSESDLETDALNSAIITVICKSDSDMEFWADKSSDDDRFDAEISDCDKWLCSTCSTLNKPPNRYCERCYETRNGWLPSKKKLPKRKSRSQRKRVSATKTNEESTQNNRINICEFPSTPTTSSRQESDLPLSEKGMKQSDNSNSVLLSDSVSNLPKLCILCCERPANATLIHAHTKYAHTITCYPCAKKLKDQKKRCPICRRTIDRVVKQIF